MNWRDLDCSGVESFKGQVYNGKVLKYTEGDYFRLNGEGASLAEDGRILLSGNACDPGIRDVGAAILCLVAAEKMRRERSKGSLLCRMEGDD